jgi:Zn-dependent alcohol dehydrogenase
VKGRTELPGLVDKYTAGKLKVDEFITHRFEGLDHLNEAFHVMHGGPGSELALRPVIRLVGQDVAQ